MRQLGVSSPVHSVLGDALSISDLGASAQPAPLPVSYLRSAEVCSLLLSRTPNSIIPIPQI